uniref:Uncharacterized protein n=1 Tax=Rhipicephalus pulchellus TaxID=72859 RepID=L7LXQ3_RHIPC
MFVGFINHATILYSPVLGDWNAVVSRHGAWCFLTRPLSTEDSVILLVKVYNERKSLDYTPRQRLTSGRRPSVHRRLKKHQPSCVSIEHSMYVRI